MSHKGNYVPQNKKPQVKAATSTQGKVLNGVVNFNSTTLADQKSN